MATEYIGHLREFDPANSDWSIFKERVDSYFVANKITDDKRKGAILSNILSEDAYKLLYNLCIPEEPESKIYSELSFLLTEYFKPSESVFGSRYKSQNETPKEWAVRLKSLSSSCQFTNEELKVLLRDVFIVSYNKGPVQDRLMEEKESVTFDEVVEVAAVKSVIHPTSSNSNLEHFIKKEPELHYASSKNPHFRGRVQSGSTGDAAGLGPSTSHHVRPTSAQSSFPPPSHPNAGFVVVGTTQQMYLS